jgi:hypothetical protein
MILFKIHYVSEAEFLTEKEKTFVKQVQNAAWVAYNRTATGMTTDEWNANAFLYVTKAEAEKFLNKTVGTPSVVVLYRASEKEQFKGAYLKGVGAPAAWTAAFERIFNLVPIEQRRQEGGDNPKGTNTGGDGHGTSNGAGGNGNGFGFGLFGSRGCNVLDDLLADMGITDTLQKLFYGAGAVYLGSRALQSGNKTGQVVQGGGAAYLAYLALTSTAACGNAKKKLKI